jgi:hypothetical protein
MDQRFYCVLAAGEDPETLLQGAGRRTPAFPDLDAFYRFTVGRDPAMAERCVLVELEGEAEPGVAPAPEEGAVPVRPHRILGVHPIDPQRAAPRRGHGASA